MFQLEIFNLKKRKWQLTDSCFFILLAMFKSNVAFWQDKSLRRERLRQRRLIGSRKFPFVPKFRGAPATSENGTLLY